MSGRTGTAYGGTPSDASVIRAIARSQGARAGGHVLSVHPDGHSGRQYAARSVIRARPAAGLSLARPHHLRSGAGPAGIARQTRRVERRSCVRRNRGAGRLPMANGAMRRMVLHYAQALRAGGRRRYLSDRQRVARADDAARRRGDLSVRGGAGSARGRRSRDPAATRRSPTPPTGRNISGISRRTDRAMCSFHLDPLWASPDVDFIGIDNYMPLTDWRDGATHLDRLAGHARSTTRLSPSPNRRRRRL